MRVIEPSTTGYFPKYGEKVNPADLKAYYCVGHCQEPVICDGDYCIVNINLTPEIGDYISYHRGCMKLAKDAQGRYILTSNEGSIYPEGPFEGVIVQVNHKPKSN